MTAKKNATVAVIGAGDYIGSAIAKRFAAEGYTVFAGRRTADKLTSLKSEIENAGGACEIRGLDARKEDDVSAFLAEADAHAREAGFSSSSSSGSPHPSVEPPPPGRDDQHQQSDGQRRPDRRR